MADWKTRLITGFIAGPLIFYLINHKLTTAAIANCNNHIRSLVMVFILHNEYSKIIATIMKFNSSESDIWYIDTMQSSIVFNISNISSSVSLLIIC